MLVICWGWFWLSWGAAAPGMERVSRVGIFWGPLAEGRALLYLLQPSSRAACSHWLEPVSFPSLCEMQASSEGTSREETSVPSPSQRCLPRGGGEEWGQWDHPGPPPASSHCWTRLPAAIPPRIPPPRAIASCCQAGSFMHVPGMC